MFAEEIKKIVEGTPHGIGGLIMGLDGIPIDQYISPSREFDVNTVGMEFSYILGQVRKAGESLKLGGVSEMVVKAEGMTLLLRMLTHEYFLAIIVGAKGNAGKLRYLMRMAETRLRPEL